MATAFAIRALGPIQRPEVVPKPPVPVTVATATNPTPATTGAERPARSEAEPGDLVTFHYVVYGPDGREVANSVARGLPYTERLGESVRGWQASLVGVRTGEVRNATVPTGPGLPGFGSAASTVQMRFSVLRVVKRADVALLAGSGRPITND